MRTYNEIDNDLHKAEVNIKNIKTGKQDKLTAGDGIQIVNNVISATGGGGGGNNTYEHKIKIVFNSPNSTQEEIYLSILSTHETDYTTIRDIAHNIAWNRYIGANAAFTGTAGVPFIGTSVRFIDLGDGETFRIDIQGMMYNGTTWVSNTYITILATDIVSVSDMVLPTHWEYD